MEALKQRYTELTKTLNRIYTDCTLRTGSEYQIMQELVFATKLKFYKSFWIVNRNVDLFCPAISSTKMRGLVIEVDGSIHDRTLKIKKDESKYRLLHDLNIGLCVIENHDVFSPQVQNLIKQLRTIVRLDSRARKRILRDIYISTLVFHADDEIMVSLFGDKFRCRI